MRSFGSNPRMRGMQVTAKLSGAAAARYILDEAGCQDVAIEETPGTLSDHYDPRQRVLRLSSEVYNGRTATSVGIAAHESGHALQHAQNYLPLILRNAAVPAATFGGAAFSILLIVGIILASFMHMGPLGFKIILLGIVLYGAVLVFQVINLPVEFDASAAPSESSANIKSSTATGRWLSTTCSTPPR